MLSAAVLVGLYVRHRHATLDGEFQGWGSASCLLMARAFNRLGALRMHFVPFQNNLPVGADPDVYLHWPPLYPLLLALVLRVFGDSVFVARLFTLLINLLSGASVGLVARRLFSPRIAWLSVFFFFTSRAVYVGNAALLQQGLAMLFCLASVACFLRALPLLPEAAPPPHARWFGALGLLASALTVFSAWDPVFTPFGLLAAAWWLRHRRGVRLAALYCAANLAAFAAVEADYILSYPKLFANQFATILFRAGLHFKADTSLRLPTFVDAAVFNGQFGLIAGTWRALRFAVQFLSPLSLAAVLLFVALWAGAGGLRRETARRTPAMTWLAGGLLLPGLVWYAALRNYVAVHPFPLILFVPATAIASGFLLDRLGTKAASGTEGKSVRFVLLYLVPAVLLLPLVIEYRDAEVVPPPEFADLSQLIGAETPPAAVVLTPTTSLIPTLYSQRHVVRGIQTGAWLRLALAEAHEDFPGAPVYLAVKARDVVGHEEIVTHLRLLAHQGDAALYALP